MLPLIKAEVSGAPLDVVVGLVHHVPRCVSNGLTTSKHAALSRHLAPPRKRGGLQILLGARVARRHVPAVGGVLGHGSSQIARSIVSARKHIAITACSRARFVHSLLHIVNLSKTSRRCAAMVAEAPCNLTPRSPLVRN